MDGCEFECGFYIFVSLLPSLLLRWVPLIVAIVLAIRVGRRIWQDDSQAGVAALNVRKALACGVLFLISVAWAIYYET